MADFDLVIRNGNVVDGTGGSLQSVDVGVRAGVIEAVGARLGRGTDEIDAKGLLVTPGFVDVHTHYDGQATWSDRLDPSSTHGVTTVLTGNCGVGFAPCRPGDRDALIRLMEGVEDIPGTALHEGLPWNWESFPDYLDALAARPRDIDMATMVPHGALRVFAMGQRGIDRDPATEDDCAVMAEAFAASMRAGALGLATSRTIAHRTVDGDLTPMYGAAAAELTALASGLREGAGGVFQMVSDFADEAAEFGLIEAMAQASGRPASFSLLQTDGAPFKYRSLLARTEAANLAGLTVRAQVLSRPIGVLMGLDASIHPFQYRATYRTLAHLPLAERVKAMRDPATKAAILAEPDDGAHPLLVYYGKSFGKLFALGDPPDYAPPPSASLAARAARDGRDPAELAYETLLESDGAALIYLPLYNFTSGDLSAVAEMMAHPLTIFGLADGGAHVGTICDASSTTYLLTRWVRETGEVGLPEAIAALSARPAHAVGLGDRGILKPGFKADINLIDLDALGIAPPQLVRDLPAGGKRFIQGARGYRANIVSGIVTYRDGISTGALPGQLVRGAR